MDAVEAEGEVGFGAETVSIKIIECTTLLEAQGLDFTPGWSSAAEGLVVDLQRGFIPDGLLDEGNGFLGDWLAGRQEGIAATDGSAKAVEHVGGNGLQFGFSSGF